MLFSKRLLQKEIVRSGIERSTDWFRSQIQSFRVSEKFVQGWKISICSYLPANEHIPFQGTFESMIFLFPRWDMRSFPGGYTSLKRIASSQFLTESVGLLLVPKQKSTACWSVPLRPGDMLVIIDILHQTNHRSRFLRNIHQVCISSLFGGGFKDVYFQNPA